MCAEYAKDLAHDIYLNLTQLDGEKINDLNNRGKLKAYIVGAVIRLSRETRKKRRIRYISREHSQLMIDVIETDILPTDHVLTLNWSSLTDFETLLLSKFVEVKNINEMSKIYGIHRNTISEYINTIKRKLCT